MVFLREEVYMVPLEGYVKAEKGHVCKLKRSLYGLKQASREWNTKLTNKLLQFGFTQSAYYHYLFVKITAHSFMTLLVYVVDLLVMNSVDVEIDVVRKFLDSTFTINDLGLVK